MSRHFVNISLEDFILKFKNLVKSKTDFRSCYIPWKTLTNKIYKDLSKVEFDLENTSERVSINRDGTDLIWEDESDFGPNEIHGFRTLPNGMHYFGMSAGGDWENPIFFIYYWDGKGFRGYIPEDGNPYNKEMKSAYGNNDDDSDEESDEIKIVEDITKRIVLK